MNRPCNKEQRREVQLHAEFEISKKEKQQQKRGRKIDPAVGEGIGEKGKEPLEGVLQNLKREMARKGGGNK